MAQVRKTDGKDVTGQAPDGDNGAVDERTLLLSAAMGESPAAYAEAGETVADDAPSFTETDEAGVIDAGGTVKIGVLNAYVVVVTDDRVPVVLHKGETAKVKAAEADRLEKLGAAKRV